ncbi:MAG: hypothetical protein ABIC57_02290, partial [bacterium]
MDVPTSTVMQEFHEAESFKNEVDKPLQNFPSACHYIHSWEKTELLPEQLEKMDIYVNTRIKDTGPDGTLSIFRELGTTNIGQIAKNLDYLKSLNEPSIKIWLSHITPNMEKLILSKECPSILIIKPALLNYGNLPDGNRRVIAALDLANKGYMGISLTAYVGKIDRVFWVVWNSGVYIHRSNISEKEKRTLV